VLRASLILVVDHGHIVERGTHAQLLECDGLYARLYEEQFLTEDGGARGESALLIALVARRAGHGSDRRVSAAILEGEARRSAWRGLLVCVITLRPTIR